MIILAMIAGIVIPRYYSQLEKGVITEAVAKLSAIRQGEEAFNLEYGTYIHSGDAAAAPVPAFSWTVLGIDSPDNTKFTYAITGTATTFTATATRVDDASTTLDCPGKTIVITNAGVFSGTHPFGPTPDAGATCS